ncbi:hypothetical protein BU15DRAFT_63554 [Melanogaster broomeanus]|nr:hypothetical protein BU15DRAFT_63554 [Melanogaster broomeanus]
MHFRLRAYCAKGHPQGCVGKCILGVLESVGVTWDVQGDRLGCPNILGHPEIVWVTHCTWNTPRGVRESLLKNWVKHKMSYIHKELFTVLLNVKQGGQRDQLVQNLHVILSAFVKMANYKLAPIGETPTQIVLLDQASFQTKGPMDTGAPLPLE